jgi:hypothetical protein
MPLKTYETIGILNRYLTANIEGRDIPVAFINGTSAPRQIQGKFTTNNPKIQEWIENSGGYNKKYRLISTIPLPAEKKTYPPEADNVDDDKVLTGKHPQAPDHDDLGTATPPDMSIPEETDEDLPTDIVEEILEEITTEPVSHIVGDSVVNGQQARNYLMEHFKDITFRQVQKNEQIISEAKSRGVQFTQWETFVASK